MVGVREAVPVLGPRWASPSGPAPPWCRCLDNGSFQKLVPVLQAVPLWRWFGSCAVSSLAANLAQSRCQSLHLTGVPRLQAQETKWYRWESKAKSDHAFTLTSQLKGPSQRLPRSTKPFCAGLHNYMTFNLYPTLPSSPPRQKWLCSASVILGSSWALRKQGQASIIPFLWPSHLALTEYSIRV